MTPAYLKMDSARPTNETKAGKPVRPKRPLSAFNLFYRFKRQKALEAIASGTADKEAISNLLMAAPGMEHYPSNATKMASLHQLNDLRRQNIRKDLENNLLPRDTRTRAHRTNQRAMNGSMSFLEMGKIMNSSWKSCDDFAKSVFNELAEEGREQYRQRVDEYNDLLSSKKVAARASPTVSLEDHFATAETMIQLKCPGKYDKVSPSPPLAEEVAGGSYSGSRSISNQSDDPSMHGSPQENTGPFHSSSNETEASLRARVKALEDELAAEKLRSRVRELEDELLRRKGQEEQARSGRGMMRREDSVSGSSDHSSTNAPAPFWPHASQSKIPPSMERSAYSTMPQEMQNSPSLGAERATMSKEVELTISEPSAQHATLKEDQAMKAVSSHMPPDEPDYRAYKFKKQRSK
eukprot:CAMPEP_0183761282 /NCGR_PEP_ID=MMETSP0739-20130205/8334_1 /TAXON_ID=385413 /ORGANISM="Thalassiosira miniscula, Strain CCMP1093" /LENGTH=407 /DNA_ID=CAMNT_0025999399 /DNA_START=95 /DNA_END=1318 /DNA_ORIENTATION=-